MDNVVPFKGNTLQKLEPDMILEANKGVFSSLWFFGRDKEGKFVAGSSESDVGEAFVMMELLKNLLMEDVK